MARKMLIIGLLMIAVGAGFYLYHRKVQQQKALQATQAEIVLVERKDLSETVDGDGEVVFSKNGGIYPAYKATVQKINCKAGDKVKKGDLLMVLSSDTLRSSWVEAEYNYQTVKLNLTKAQQDLERQQKLYQIQGTTVDDLESAQNTVDLNQVALREAESNLELLTETTDEANFVGSDHRSILIRAPFNGEVSWVQVKPGQIVSAIGTSSSDDSSNNLLLYLVADDSLEVEATVDETDIDQVKVGQKAKVVLNDTRQTELYGIVTEVGSYGSEDSGVIVFPVRIRLNDVEVTVRPNMTADISIVVTSNPNVLVVPTTAILDVMGKTMVKKVSGAQTELVEVELGVSNDSYVEVKSGLSEGDQVLITQKTDTSSKTNNQSRQRSMMGGPPM